VIRKQPTEVGKIQYKPTASQAMQKVLLPMQIIHELDNLYRDCQELTVLPYYISQNAL